VVDNRLNAVAACGRGPALGVLDLSAGPSGLSRYLEMLWPALTAEFRVSVFGHPNGPYAAWPGAAFVPLPAALWPARPVDTGEPNGPGEPRREPHRFGVRKLYRGAVPAWGRHLVGLARHANVVANVLRTHRLDCVYMPLCDLEFTPFAAWLAGIPGRVGVFHLPPQERVSAGTRQLTRAMLRRLTACVAVSDRVGADWQALDRSIRKRTTIIPNGISLPDPGAPPEPRERVLARHGLPNDGRAVWLAAGRLAPQKGFAHLLDAVSALGERHQRVLFAIAGEGPLRAELAAQIARLGLTQRVYLLGQVTGLDPLMRIADGFVLPSVSEAMPYVLLEAMSHGRPVVATAVGGVPELVRNGENGVLCPPGSPEALARGLDYCLSHPDVARLMAAAACETVRRSFSVGVMRADTLAVFRAEATGPGAGRSAATRRPRSQPGGTCTTPHRLVDGHKKTT